MFHRGLLLSYIGMVSSDDKKGDKRMTRSQNSSIPPWLTAIAPALLVLLFTVAFSAFFGGPHLLKGWQAIWKTFLRFFRFTLVLCLPLYTLVPMYGFIVERMKEHLLQIEKKRDFTTHRLKHWAFRPFQGIGIGLLFSTKLLNILQLIAGSTVKASLLIPEGQFELARLLMITAVSVFISLLLSILWTLDDMGIRYFNRKDQEFKMIGKYAGTIVPVVFGMYGLLGLLANYPTDQAFIYAFKIIVVLYPPLMVFAVAHAYLLRKKAGLLKRTLVKKGGILEYE